MKTFAKIIVILAYAVPVILFAAFAVFQEINEWGLAVFDKEMALIVLLGIGFLGYYIGKRERKRS